MLRKTLLTLCLLLVATFAAAEGFKVSDILVEGNDRIETSSILAAVSFKPGDQVTLEVVDQAMRNIFALGRFDDISAELTEIQGAKLITFVVHELPLVRDVLFEGYKEIKEDKLRTYVSVKIPEIYNQAKVRASVLEIKKAYAEEGYRAAQVEPQVTIDDRNEAVVTFKIEEGKKVLIDSLRFIGNKSVDADELKDGIQTKERWWLSWLTGRGAYKEDEMQIDLERIKSIYQDKGYMDVKVTQPQLSLIEENKYLEIQIEIDEGVQYRLGTLGVKGDLLKPRDELLELVSLKPEALFVRSELRESILRLTDLYADHGYANVNVAPLTSKDSEKKTIDLMLDIEQGIKIFVEKVTVRGNSKTRDKVIRREIPIVEGEQYSASKIKEANRRLRNLGYFEEVNLTTAPGAAADQAVLNVDVKEQPTGTFSIGAGYSSVDAMILQGSLSQNNFLGYGYKLNFSAAYSGSSQTFSLGLSDPYFLDTNWTVGIEAYKSEREYDRYDDYRTGGALKAGHALTKYSKGYLTYRYEQQEILNVTEEASTFIKAEEGDKTLSSITGEIVRNSTDYHQDPSRGGLSKFSLEYAGLGGTEKFVKAQAGHRHFFPLFWGTVFSTNGQIGYVTSTSDDDVSIGERFFLGGIRTLRGFKTREVGPQDPDTDDYRGGEKMAYFNFEYIFPLAQSLGLKGLLFYDTGNVWLDDESYFSDMRSSVGAGIRWLSPLGPLRFEWGYNLSPRDDEKQSVFEFSIGTAF